jgi:hypothetical protein
LPLRSTIVGALFAPAPVCQFHSSFPLRASYACRRPSLRPMKTTFPFVVVEPA